LYLTDEFNWSEVSISPKARLEELVIETSNLPKNFFEIPLKPKWFKIKFLAIEDLRFFWKMLKLKVLLLINVNLKAVF
jgi:hypothetical protein